MDDRGKRFEEEFRSAELANVIRARDTWRERAETAQECAARAEAERATMADRLAQLDTELSAVRRELKAAQCVADEAHENAKRWREECARAWLHVSEAAAERAKELDEDDDG